MEIREEDKIFYALLTRKNGFSIVKKLDTKEEETAIILFEELMETYYPALSYGTLVVGKIVKAKKVELGKR